MIGPRKLQQRRQEPLDVVGRVSHKYVLVELVSLLGGRSHLSRRVEQPKAIVFLWVLLSYPD